VGELIGILRFADARNAQLSALQAVDIAGILLRSNEFILAAPQKVQEIVEKLAHIGGAHKMLQMQLADSLAQLDPQILVSEQPERLAAANQDAVAVFMKGTDVQGAEIHSAELRLHPASHLLGAVLGISDSQDFIGLGVALANEASDSLGKHRGLAGTRARH